jgi:hypothetical protein
VRFSSSAAIVDAINCEFERTCPRKSDLPKKLSERRKRDALSPVKADVVVALG